MKWISVEEQLPNSTHVVFVSNGDKYGPSYAAAWFRKLDKAWIAHTYMLKVQRYSRGRIALNGEVKYWMEILEFEK